MMNIIKMTAEHCAAVAEIEKECFSEPWSENALRDGVARDDARYFVAVSGGEAVGYIGSHTVLGEVSITNIAVKKAMRRRGAANALLNTLLEDCKKANDEFVTLEVRTSNAAAIALYEKNGFKKVGTRKNFYSSPCEDALLYTYFIGD